MVRSWHAVDIGKIIEKSTTAELDRHWQHDELLLSSLSFNSHVLNKS